MIYLLLAILSSALVSVIMRLSTDKTSGGVSMLAANYAMCVLIAGAYLGGREVFPEVAGLNAAVVMGIIHGALYLISFAVFQLCVKRKGIVLSATFMKLGLLVPMVLSVFLFGEIPGKLQLIGFCIAVVAIILINYKKEKDVSNTGGGLLLLLLLGSGGGDAMAKVFEELGNIQLSEQFLFYTFVVALLLCIGLVLYKKEKLYKNDILYGMIIGVPNFFSAKFLLKALEYVPAVITYPTYSVSTLLVVTVTGVVCFKERLSRRQWVAVGAILAALALLNLS